MPTGVFSPLISYYLRGSLCGWWIGGKEWIACWATMWHAAKWRVVVVAIEVLAIGIVALRKYVPGIVEDRRDWGELLPGLVNQQGGCLVAPFAYKALDEVSAKGQRQCCWADEMMRDARDCQSKIARPALAWESPAKVPAPCTCRHRPIVCLLMQRTGGQVDRQAVR